MHPGLLLWGSVPPSDQTGLPALLERGEQRPGSASHGALG